MFPRPPKNGQAPDKTTGNQTGKKSLLFSGERREIFSVEGSLWTKHKGRMVALA